MTSPAPLQTTVRLSYVPVVVGLAGLVIWLADREAHVALVLTLAIAVALSFAAERLAAYDRSWNEDHNDRERDALHAVVNETLNLASVAALPLIASTLVVADIWPAAWPFPLQVAFAVVVFDAGVTLAHWASHRQRILWSFHAVSDQ